MITSYTGYPIIIDSSSMEWVVIGYLTHISIAVMQASLAGVLIVSGMSNTFLKGQPPLKKLLIFFSLSVDLPENIRFLAGIKQLVFGTALLLPFFLGVTYLFSAIGALSALIFLIYIEVAVAQHKKYNERFFALGFITFAIISTSFSVYERVDNLRFGVDIAFKAKTFRDKEIAWQQLNDPHSPKVNDSAPDFTLNSVDGVSSHKLSEFLNQGKPVVLFFGANSCPAFSEGTVGINRLHEKYGDTVNFVGVYLKEPHPTDEWWLTPSRWSTFLYNAVNSRVAVDIKQPNTFEERFKVAQRAHKNLLNPEIELLVDNTDNAVNNQWTGQPTRIYLLSPEGKIIYNPGSGPYSFNPDYLEPELKKYFTTL